MSKKHVILIAGPTAVGKSDCAVTVARHFDAQILSADSRQCFRELSIGTAVPSKNDMDQVLHHFLHSHSVHEEMSAGIYERYALEILDEIFKKDDIVVVTGGTGLYIQSLLYGMDEMPATDKTIEYEVNRKYEEAGIDYLKTSLEAEDTYYTEHGDMQNPARMLRALIFYRSHRQSILRFQKKNPKERTFSTVKIGLELPREMLYERINARVDMMIETGLLEEVERMYSFQNLKSLQTVGYQEFYTWGHWPLTEEEIRISVDLVKQNSRRYAKRQLTWFKNREQLQWFRPDETNAIISYIEDNMTS